MHLLSNKTSAAITTQRIACKCSMPR